MRAVAVLCALAAGFWLVLFFPWTAGRVNFWGLMAAAAGVLACSALALDRARLVQIYTFQSRYVVIGAASAVILYFVFYLGNAISTRLFAFAGSQVEGIYAGKTQASPAFIAVLLLAWIGPAEEVFWRGFVQRRLGERVGPVRGYILASLVYGGVHLWAFNFMLLMAALVAGLFWGAMLLRYGSVWPGIISHALWDVAIFVIWPIQ